MERTVESFAGVAGDEDTLYNRWEGEVSRWLYKSVKMTKNTWGETSSIAVIIYSNTLENSGMLASRSNTQSVSGSVLLRRGVSSFRPSNIPCVQLNTVAHMHTTHSTVLQVCNNYPPNQTYQVGVHPVLCRPNSATPHYHSSLSTAMHARGYREWSEWPR